MRGIVAALVLLLATGCASVDGPDTYKDTAEAPACTAAVAKSMDVRKLISQADRLLGACVRVRGLADGQYLYADRDAIYQQPRNASGLSSNGGALGLQRDGDNAGGGAGLSESELVGTLGDCGRIQDDTSRYIRETGNFIMLGGLCHYTSDLFLSVDEERVLGPLRWERQLPVHGGRGYGDLTPAPAGSFLRERVQQVAISFLTALRDGDRVQVSDLHHKFFTSDDSPEVMLTYLFDDPDSPFQSLRLAEPVAQMEIFAYREPLWRSGPEEPQSEQYAVACFCQTPDCRKAWPINSGGCLQHPHAALRVRLRDTHGAVRRAGCLHRNIAN